MSVDARVAWIRANREDARTATEQAAADALATARRTQTETQARETAARVERQAYLTLAGRAWDGLFGPTGIFRQEHEVTLETLRQNAQTARTRIQADRDVEIARARAQTGTTTTTDTGGSGTATLGLLGLLLFLGKTFLK
jgi:hypothetical protein